MRQKASGLAETQRLCEAAGSPQRQRVTTHIADVADRTRVERLRDEVAGHHQTDKTHLLFNNAGIGGGGRMVTNSRDEWESTKCSVVMPGQFGPRSRELAQDPQRRDVSQLSDDQLLNLVSELEQRSRDNALTSAAQAATIILDGVKANRWRILVGR